MLQSFFQNRRLQCPSCLRPSITPYWRDWKNLSEEKQSCSVCFETSAAPVLWSKHARWPVEDHGWCMEIFLLGEDLYQEPYCESGQRVSCKQQAWSCWRSKAKRSQLPGIHGGIHIESRERDKYHCEILEMLKKKKVVFMQPCAEVVEDQERDQGKWTLLRNVNQALKPTTILAVR